MAENSSIEWTHRPGTIPCTWQVTCGCLHHSIGCGNCYAEFMAWRLANMARADTAAGRDPGRKRHYVEVIDMEKRRWNGKVAPIQEAIADPIGWRKPRTVFVDSMSDLFYGDLQDQQECNRRDIPFTPVPFEFIDEVFAIMARTAPHTYIVLTKRARRMAEYFQSRTLGDVYTSILQLADGERAWSKSPHDDLRSLIRLTDSWEVRDGYVSPHAPPKQWPLPNVWLGTSQENQQQAIYRTRYLRQCPAAVRFVSYEPALGPVDGFAAGWWSQGESEFDWIPHIDQLIMGCESKGSRVGRLGDFKTEEAYREHAAFQVACCANAGVSMFQKQVPINGRISHEPAEWDEVLRVREFPEVAKV